MSVIPADRLATIDRLCRRSQWLRQALVDLVAPTRQGHLASALSCAELVLALYYAGYVRFNPARPRDLARDRVLVSKGHAAMVLYPILADLGFFDRTELQRFGAADGRLRVYADPSIPGIEAISGSLGHAFGIGCGYAYAAKRDGRDSRTFVVLSDGECYEGSVWEAAMLAGHHRLDNLIAIVDRNRLCILGDTEDCLRLDPLADKWTAFGWDVAVVDGHRYAEILPALDRALSPAGRPLAILAHTVKGKGISFMENRVEWHTRTPTDEDIARAREDLRSNPIAG
jgi:transketolase